MWQCSRKICEVSPDQETVALAGQIRSGLVKCFPAPSNDGVVSAVQQATTSHPCVQNEWTGIMNINPDGLALIQGYDLWFTSNATGKWRIWRLQSATEWFAATTISLDRRTMSTISLCQAVSPDGAKVAFSAGICFSTGSVRPAIFTSRTSQTRAVQRLTHSALDEYHPTWSPQGDLTVYHAGIARTANDPGINYGLWTLNVSSGQATN